MDENTWPDDFVDIGGKTFAWVWENRKEFVDFTLNDMTKPTGLFDVWKKYCLNKTKQHD